MIFFTTRLPSAFVVVRVVMSEAVVELVVVSASCDEASVWTSLSPGVVIVGDCSVSAIVDCVDV